MTDSPDRPAGEGPPRAGTPPGGTAPDRGETQPEDPFRTLSPSAEDSASAYARGYGDGVRGALREVISLAARGHTASEIRLLAQTRLSKLGDEVALRRKSLLAPPQRVPLESLVRPRLRGEGPNPQHPPAAPGSSYLFLEVTPREARTFLKDLLGRGVRGLALTRIPQDLRPVAPPPALAILHLGGGGAPEEGVEAVQSDPNYLTSHVANFWDSADGPGVVHFEAFEYMQSETSFEKALKFVHWLVGSAQSNKGYLVVTLDPGSLEGRQLSVLKKDFNHTVSG